MGLSLSVWLLGRTAVSPPSNSSVFRSLSVSASPRLRVILSSPPATPGDIHSRWSSTHRSPHFQLSACRAEATRQPVERSSDGMRAEEGARDGLHVWEVAWSPGHRGSHAVLGVSGPSCPLQTSGYDVLVGGDSQSWGWELKTNQLWHDGQRLGWYPGRGGDADATAETPLPIPERILLVLDADARTLGFVVDGYFLGVAFHDLPVGVEMFPAVSSVRGGARIRLRYLNGATRDPPSLMALCALSIRKNLGPQDQKKTRRLPLPGPLKQYLLCRP